MTGWSQDVIGFVLCMDEHPRCDECDGRGRPMTEDEEVDAYIRFCSYLETGHPPRH